MLAKMAMMAMTTSSSIRVNPGLLHREADFAGCGFIGDRVFVSLQRGDRKIFWCAGLCQRPIGSPPSMWFD
jgi:hypothetical protein